MHLFFCLIEESSCCYKISWIWKSVVIFKADSLLELSRSELAGLSRCRICNYWRGTVNRKAYLAKIRSMARSIHLFEAVHPWRLTLSITSCICFLKQSEDLASLLHIRSCIEPSHQTKLNGWLAEQTNWSSTERRWCECTLMHSHIGVSWSDSSS